MIKKIKYIVLGGLCYASLLMAEPVSLPTTPCKMLYVGGSLGGAWGRHDWEYTNFNHFNTKGVQHLGQTFGFNVDNFIGGAYAGLSYQTMSPWFLGVEGSFLGTRLARTEASPFNSRDRYTSNLNELASVKGRLGYEYQRWSPYITGGGAFANTSLTLADQLYRVLATTTPWNRGWTLGAGLDYQLTSHVAVGLAYDYADISLSQNHMSCVACGIALSTSSPVVNGMFVIQSLMARLSYFVG